jgi:hypothetical protein
VHGTSRRFRQVCPSPTLLLGKLLHLCGLNHELGPDATSQLSPKFIELIVSPAHDFRALDKARLQLRSLARLVWVGGRFW